MKQKYFFSFFIIVLLFFAIPAEAQDTTSTGHKTEVPISGLSIYPNPVTNGKVYISTTRNLEKEIEIYNVLGKPVKKIRLRGRELDVSSLTPGIYILKIEEQNNRATRKLVIK
ncbi:T9SS type A sorting domain-containing protein [Zunongwangia sp. H14]|uniref:T9SS type A sorting domain-containing protein n=1 Tax=Zunongwangia sp. H14 TaxID=3240792 RepID=UPI0035628BF1